MIDTKHTVITGPGNLTRLPAITRKPQVVEIDDTPEKPEKRKPSPAVKRGKPATDEYVNPKDALKQLERADSPPARASPTPPPRKPSPSPSPSPEFGQVLL